MAGFAIRRDLYLEAALMLTEEDKKSIFSDEVLSRWILIKSNTVCFCNARYYYRYNTESITQTNIYRYVNSKLISTDSLISLAKMIFGINSSTHLLAIENKFFTIVEALRLINVSHLPSRQQRDLIKVVSGVMRKFDITPLKGIISPRYFALMRLPVPIARMLLKMIDPIVRLKNGI